MSPTLPDTYQPNDRQRPIAAEAPSMRTFSWPSPWRNPSREMTMEKKKKITHNHPMWKSGFELDHTFQVFYLITA